MILRITNIQTINYAITDNFDSNRSQRFVTFDQQLQKGLKVTEKGKVDAMLLKEAVMIMLKVDLIGKLINGLGHFLEFLLIFRIKNNNLFLLENYQRIRKACPSHFLSFCLVSQADIPQQYFNTLWILFLQSTKTYQFAVRTTNALLANVGNNEYKMSNPEQPNDLLSKVTEAARIMSSIKEIYAQRDYYKQELNRQRQRRQSQVKCKSQKDQQTLKQITQKYEDTIQKIRKDHQFQSQSIQKTISDKDRRIQSLSSLNSQLQHNFAMHQNEINSIKGNLVNKEEKKLLSKLDEDLKKIDTDTQLMKKCFQEEVNRLASQIDCFESQSMRYRKERDDYRSLYERAEARIKDQSCKITEMSFEIEKLKLDKQHVEICLDLEEKPQEVNDGQSDKQFQEFSGILKVITESIKDRKDHCVEVERLHRHINSLTQQNSELRKQYLQKCSELDSIRSQINPKVYQEDMAMKNPSTLEYLNAKRNEVEIFEKDLRQVYHKVEQIKDMMDKFQNKDIAKAYTMTQEIENTKKMIKQIIAFYRNFLQSMYFESRKQRKGGKKQQQVRAEHICCRCSTHLNRLVSGSSNLRCQECKNEVHESCVAQDYPSYFPCMGIKELLKDQTP